MLWELFYTSAVWLRPTAPETHGLGCGLHSPVGFEAPRVQNGSTAGTVCVHVGGWVGGCVCVVVRLWHRGCTHNTTKCPKAVGSNVF